MYCLVRHTKIVYNKYLFYDFNTFVAHRLCGSSNKCWTKYSLLMLTCGVIAFYYNNYYDYYHDSIGIEVNSLINAIANRICEELE